MRPHDPVPLDDDVLIAIGHRHDLDWDTVEAIPSAGIINSIYALGANYVLRIPLDHPAHVEQAVQEAAVIPIAVAAGVRTPALVAYDDTRDLLPVPYLIVERVHGSDAESLPHGTIDTAAMWRQVGRDLAQLHVHADSAATRQLAGNNDFVFADPRVLVDQRVQDGWISPIEARWLIAWLDRLAETGSPGATACLVHGDVQTSNVLVADGSYQALIDWGCARADDPASDFLAMPMAAVPHLLAGHRDVAPLPDDDNAEARILWRRLQTVLAVLPRGAAPRTTWGERPIAWLIDLLRFFAGAPADKRWTALAPPALE